MASTYTTRLERQRPDEAEPYAVLYATQGQYVFLASKQIL